MLLTRLLHDRTAGVAPLLGLCIIPLVGAVGAAVDYSRAASVHTSMQMALDSTALMLSKQAQGLDGAALGSKATAYFNALFQRPEVSGVQITQEFGSPALSTFSLKITGTTSLPTVFWRVLGKDHIDITATGEVLWGIKKLNLALALDNTGSMSSSSKMTELKKAAHTLLTTLQNAAQTPGDVKVSIVPFATDVNVGTGNVNATWIEWTDWNAANGTCSNNNYDKNLPRKQRQDLDADRDRGERCARICACHQGGQCQARSALSGYGIRPLDFTKWRQTVVAIQRPRISHGGGARHRRAPARIGSCDCYTWPRHLDCGRHHDAA